MTESAPRSDSILVVGASQAGTQLVASLRDLGHQGPLTLAGAETRAPYHRPPLSKRVLQEGFTDESVQLRNAQFYEDRSITLRLDTRIERIEYGLKGAGTAWTTDGEPLTFDRLALTIGAEARRLRLPGHDLDNVLTLRTIEDAVTLRTRLETSEQVVVIGGGFIGLEVAASARTMGKNVTVVLANGRLMERAVGTEVSDHFLKAHTANGTTVHLSARPTEFVNDGRGAVSAVLLENGQCITADLVVVGVGAAPSTELAAGAGLEVEDGVLVDSRCLASDGWTVAAGDCAKTISPLVGRGPERVRFESVSTAVEQAKVAASTLVGGDLVYRAVPWFWSDQGQQKLQVVGLPHEHDHRVVRGSIEDGAFAVLYFRFSDLVAAECVNRPADFAAIRSILKAGDTIDVEQAADTTLSLKALRKPSTSKIEEVKV